MNEIGRLCPVGRLIATPQPAQSFELCCRRRLPRTGALLCWPGSDHIAASRGVDSRFPHPGERSLLLPNPATPAIHALMVQGFRYYGSIVIPLIMNRIQPFSPPVCRLHCQRHTLFCHGILILRTELWVLGRELRSRGKLILGYTPFNTL